MVDSINNLNGMMNFPQGSATTKKTKFKGDLNSVFKALNERSNTEQLGTTGNISFNPPTEKQKAARQKLDEKVSSTGMNYKDAKAAISKLKEKYGKDEKYQSKFESEQPKDGRMSYILPYKAFDPHKLPEPAKSEYFEALATMQEIEGANSALLQQAGLQPSETPPTNYSTGRTFDEFLNSLHP